MTAAISTSNRRPALRLVAVTIGEGDETDPAWLALLSADERERCARHRHPARRRSFAAAHALKRLLLAEALGQTPRALRFVVRDGERPVLADPPAPVVFSLSHCACSVAVALAGHGVGVDVEDAAVPVDHALAAQTLGPAAADLGPDASAEAWRDAFLTQWTVREAVLKAEGLGLSRPMPDIAVEDGRARLGDRVWRVRHWRLDADTHLALAWAGPDAARLERLDSARFHRWCEDGPNPT